MVWTYEKERSGVCREKDTGDGDAGKKEKGKAKKRWLDIMQEYMENVGVVEEDMVKRRVWRKKMHCGDPE